MQLALETSTNICSVAFRDREGEVHEKRTEVRKSHSEKLFLFIEELMKEHSFKLSDLDAMVISEGPGSYTGLRISASAVKGLLFKTEVSLYAANTLASFAAAVMEPGQDADIKIIHSIIDARRVHLYYQPFEIEDSRLISKEAVNIIPIKEFENEVQEGDVVIGTGLPRIEGEVLERVTVLDAAYISAVSLLTLFDMDTTGSFIQRVEPEQFEPKYYSSNQV